MSCMPLKENTMKHITRVTRPEVCRAQITTVLNIIGTVMSSVGALLLTITPLISKLGR